MPHSVGAPYSLFFPDLLHSFQLGWAPKFANLVDAIILLSFIKRNTRN
jgi:hypothetical protein